jgi:hypothetical protein
MHYTTSNLALTCLHPITYILPIHAYISLKRQIIYFYLRSLETDWMENEQHTLSQTLSEIIDHVSSSTADPSHVASAQLSDSFN